jgi:predicted ArsR family transcriptional regulator
MQSTRQEILDILKKSGRASVDELATRLGLTAMCIRQHLSVLERDALVNAHEERQKLGRPRHIYTLTQRAEELFPRSYHLLLDLLLEEIQELDGEEKVEKIVDRIASRLADQYVGELKKLDLEGKVRRVTEILSEAGSLAEWERIDDGFILREHNCRYHLVALRHRQVCNLERIFLSKLFEAQVTMAECLLDDSPRCTYLIPEPARSAVS